MASRIRQIGDRLVAGLNAWIQPPPVPPTKGFLVNWAIDPKIERDAQLGGMTIYVEATTQTPSVLDRCDFVWSLPYRIILAKKLVNYNADADEVVNFDEFDNCIETVERVGDYLAEQISLTTPGDGFTVVQTEAEQLTLYSGEWIKQAIFYSEFSVVYV